MQITTLAPPASAGRERRPAAVVIGSGFGGLAAAVRLGARGYRVTVCERMDAPGGRAYVHRQDGFTFDAGPTVITAPFLFEQLWALAGRRLADDVRLVPLDPFYRIRFHDGSTIDFRADAAAMRAAIARLAPGDVAGYARFMAASEAIYRVGFEQLGHVPFDAWTDMLRVLPQMVRLRSYRSLHGLVAAHVRDPRVRFALSFHPLFVGGNPFRVPAIYGLIAHLERAHGVHYALGGTGTLVSGLAKLVASQGGTLRLRAEVEAITTSGRRATGVRLAGGETIAAHVVVSNADVAHTYGRLVPAPLRRRWSERRLAQARYSMGVFVWYFGTRRQWPQVPHHTILLGPRYRGLLDDIFGHKVLASDFSLYLHRPTATDPSVAPAGCDAFYALAPVPHLAAGIDWRTQAEPYRMAIERFLESTVLPGLRGTVVTSRIATPEGFRDDLLATHGAAFGMEPVLTQSAWFRPHNRSEDVDGLFLVGAGTHPGAGVPGVISSARVLDALVPDARAIA